MRRSIKAWMDITALRGRLSRTWWGIAFRSPTNVHASVSRVPITITYDDGRPAARRRKGKKGGRRG